MHGLSWKGGSDGWMDGMGLGQMMCGFYGVG